jgi:hypothetical protein
VSGTKCGGRSTIKTTPSGNRGGGWYLCAEGYGTLGDLAVSSQRG